MNVAALQAALNARGWKPSLLVDNDLGPKTLVAVDAALDGIGTAGWAPRRRAIAAEQVIYREAGIDTGAVDGLMGPQTRAARERYEAIKRGQEIKTFRDAPAEVPAATEAAQKWPRDAGDEMRKFFGAPGSNHARLVVPSGYPMVLYDGPSEVRVMTVHERIHDPVKRVLERVLDHYGPEEICRLGFNRFFGCYNDRAKRGGSTLSTHAYAAALDFNANHNQLRWNKSRASFAHPDCEMWWRMWEAEGFVSLGRVRDFDWMHVQAARL